MKRMTLTLMAAVLLATSAMAQEEKNESRQPRKFDKTEMVKHRTNETVSRYKLSDKHAKQLLELNTKYADKMGPRGPHHPGHHAHPGAGRAAPPLQRRGGRRGLRQLLQPHRIRRPHRRLLLTPAVRKHP